MVLDSGSQFGCQPGLRPHSIVEPKRETPQGLFVAIRSRPYFMFFRFAPFVGVHCSSRQLVPGATTLFAPARFLCG
jgi:hypothetical protein